LFHTIGHISACVSFSKVVVSFTHVIICRTCFFCHIFSSVLGDRYPMQNLFINMKLVFSLQLPIKSGFLLLQVKLVVKMVLQIVDLKVLNKFS
jgi:hypothetical protein